MIYAPRSPRRTLAEIISNIEGIAKNHALPREQIVTLCNEARRSTDYKFEHENPIKAKVMEATQLLTADADGIARMPGEDKEFVSVTGVCKLAGLEPSAANLNRVARAMSELGFVRLSRTRVYPSARWFMPRAMQ